MAGTDTSLGEIERMLELRRVPLFERLDPEDLQRVAAVADERDLRARHERSSPKARSATSCS